MFLISKKEALVNAQVGLYFSVSCLSVLTAIMMGPKMPIVHFYHGNWC